MSDYIQLPNGSLFPIKSGESETDAMMAAFQQYPDAFGKKPEPQKQGSAAGDIWTALKQGAVGSTKALTDIAGPENAASQYLAKKSQELQGQYSTAAKEEMAAQAERMKKAEESGSTWEEIKAGLQNVAEAPLRSTAQGVGSLAPYVPTMLLGGIGAALRLAPGTIAALEGVANVAPKVLGTAQGVGAVKGSIYDAVYQNELEATGNEATAKMKANAAQAYAGKNIDQMIAGGVIGFVAGSSGAEKLLTKQGAEGAAAKMGTRVARAMGEEAITEGPQGAQERLAANLALQREGKDVPTMQGVLGQGVQESLIGALSAAPAAAVRGPDIAAQQRAAEEKRRQEEIARQQAEAQRIAQLAGLEGGTESRMMPDVGTPQQGLPGMEATMPQVPAVAQAPIDFQRELRLVNSRIEDLQEKAKSTPDLQGKLAIGKEFTQLETARKELEKQIAEQPKDTTVILKDLQRQMAVAETNGDIAKQVQIAQKMQELGADQANQPQAQQEFALQKFKPKTETVESFNQRVVGPEMAAGREAAEKRRLQLENELERMRALGMNASDPEYARLAREERQTQLEIQQMERQAGMNQAVTEQGQLFGETTSVARSGRTEPEIIADLRIARNTNDRKAAEKFAQELRARREGEGKTVDKTLTTEALQGKLPMVPKAAEQQQAAVEKRATSFANIVDILSKYNQGRAKIDELEAARKDVIAGIVGDVEAVRGAPMEESEKAQLARNANALLGELVRRSADTRNISSKGTKEKPLFVPAQNANGEFTTNPVPGQGFPTVENAVEGYRTFGNQYAATMSIKEGLDELRNRAVGTQTGATFGMQYAPAETTPAILRENLDRLMAKGVQNYAPEQRQALTQIADNIKAIESAPDKDRRELLGNWLYRMNVNPNTPVSQDVTESLRSLEEAKRSDEAQQGELPLTKTVGAGKPTETKTPARGEGQFSMFGKAGTGEERGKIFESPAKFYDYLASEALQQLRTDIGLVGPTLARLQKRIEPFAKRAEKLREEANKYSAELERLTALRKEQFDTLQDMNAEELKRENERITEAAQLVEQTEAELKAVTDRLDKELTSYVIEYMQARSAFEFSVKTSEDITKLIAENEAKFTEKEREAADDLAAAKKDLHDYTMTTLKGLSHPGQAKENAGKTYEELLASVKPGAAFLQYNVVEATRNLQRMTALSNTEPRITAYLEKDLDLQMQLAEEAAGMDTLVENLLNAGMALDQAKKKQERSIKNRKEIKQATEQVDAAKELLAEEKDKAAERARTVSALEKELGFEQVSIAHRISETSTDITRSTGLVTSAERALSALIGPLLDKAKALSAPADAALKAFTRRRDRLAETKPETQAEREARDRVQRKLELDALDRLAAMPGERISFEERRNMLEQSGTSDEAISELMDATHAAVETIDSMREAAGKLDTAIADMNKQVAKLEKATSTNPRTFQKKLEKNSKLVELAGLREQRDAMLKKQAQVQAGIAAIEKEVAHADEALPKLLTQKEYLEKVILGAEGTEDIQHKAKLKANIEERLNKLADLIKKKEYAIATARDAKLRKSRQNDLSRFKREYRELEAQRGMLSGLERTQLPIEPLGTEAPEAGMRLPARRLGPTVKNTVQAGNIRTGVAETLEERTSSSRNKATQAGKARPVSPQSAVKEGNVAAAGLSKTTLANAKAQLSYLADLKERVQERLEEERAGGDEEAIAKWDKRLAQVSRQLRDQKKIVAGPKNKDVTIYTGDGFSDASLTTSAQQDRLSDDGVEALYDGRTLDVLDDIAQNSPYPFIRENAAKLRNFVARTRVSISPDLTVDGEPAPAAYSSTENMVGIRPGFETEANVIHEFAHAATMRALEGPESALNEDQLAAKREINDMYAKLEEDGTLEGEYATKNVKEFVSEVYSNDKLRAKLGSKKLFGSTVLRSLYDMFLRLIGHKPSRVKMEDAQAVIDRLMMQSGKLQAAPVAAGVPSSLSDLSSKIMSQPKTFREKLGSNVALQTEMELVDMRAPAREALKVGDDKLYQQAMYNVLKADQKMAIVQSTLTDGAMESFTDEAGLRVFKSSNKNSAVPVFQAVSDIPAEDAKKKVEYATSYLIAQRALNKGASKLDTGALGIDENMLRQVMRDVDADPALKASLEKVRSTYNAYNEGLVKFLAESGKISKAKAAALLKDGDYVPYYRVQDDGTAELVYGDGVTVAIGDIRNQPYLQELKGGETKILPLDESLYRNTMLLTDAALTNMATKETAYGLQALGAGKGPIDPATGKATSRMVIRKGKGHDSKNVIRFNQEPDPNDKNDDGSRHLVVDTTGTLAEGVPTALVVDSLAGAHLPLPAFLKAASIFGDLLRSGVTRMPMYIGNQLMRDPMSATFTAGLNYGPFRAVAKAGKEFWKMSTGDISRSSALIERGLIQSNIFAGDQSDISKIALQLASGKDMSALEKVFAFMDKAALNADAATRILVYENARKNGLSDGQAQIATMESMNFYKRGRNPLVQYGNRLVPFLNAGIQGLNVLFKAARGNMPYEEQQQIKQKFYKRAVFLFGLGVAYAMAMEDDEYYKNARPRDKYTKIFVHLPGVEEPIKLPTPFEAGYFFSAAVATVDAMRNEVNRKEQWDALRSMFIGSIPGASSMGVPQIIRPMLEVWANKNFYSGAPIESARLTSMDIMHRANPNTTEFAKLLAKVIPGLSPVQIEHLANGYLGQAPVMIASMVNELFKTSDTGEAPEKRLHETPFVGQAFQKKFGGADTDYMYRLAAESLEARTTFNNLRKQGRFGEAAEFLDENKAKVSLSSAAGAYREIAGRINSDIERIRNRNDLSGNEKTARIERLELAKQELAERFSKRFEKLRQR